MFAQAVLLVGVIVSCLVGLLVVTRNIKSAVNQIFGLVTFSFISLSIVNHLSLSSDDNLLFIRLTLLFSTIGAFLTYLFLNTLRNDYKKWHFGKLSILLLFFTVAVSVLDMTSLVFIDLNILDSAILLEPGKFVYIFVTHFMLVASLAVRELIMFRLNKNSLVRKQAIIMLVGVMPMLIFTPVTNFLLPVFFHNTLFIPFAPLYTVLFVLCVGYAILKYGLFDIRLATVRSFAYILTLAVLVFVYLAAVYIVSGLLFGSDSWEHVRWSDNITNIAISLVLVIIFQPIKNFFDRITIKLFYKTQYDIDKFAAELGDILTSGADMRHLSRLIVAKIGSTLRSEKAMLCVHQIGYGASYISSPKVRSMKVLSHDIDELDEFFKSQESKILVRGLVPNSAIRELLSKVGIEIVVPLVDNGGTFGYILLGERLSGNYTEHDAKALLAVSDSVTVALQNALSMQKISDINADLENKIDVATRDLKRKNFQLYKLDVAKDEFINIASHQLRTPLTSIKGYASMILDGDAGAINDTQRRFLKEISESSNKMVHIINDFLNVSRIQAGKFILDKTLVQLDKMVRAEVSGFTEMARAADLKIDLEIEDGDYSMEIDEGKLRQVVINMIDNAIYYSTPGTTIYAKLMQKRKKVIFEVMDTGIGVPRAEQKRLFTKFYRATNAQKRRPDGTGVGLYLAKRVIAAHKGGIIFKSKENKGSTFGFYLSVK